MFIAWLLKRNYLHYKSLFVSPNTIFNKLHDTRRPFQIIYASLFWSNGNLHIEYFHMIRPAMARCIWSRNADYASRSFLQEGLWSNSIGWDCFQKWYTKRRDLDFVWDIIGKDFRSNIFIFYQIKFLCFNLKNTKKYIYQY